MGRRRFSKLVKFVLGEKRDIFTSTSVLLERKTCIAGQAIFVNFFEARLPYEGSCLTTNDIQLRWKLNY